MTSLNFSNIATLGFTLDERSQSWGEENIFNVFSPSLYFCVCLYLVPLCLPVSRAFAFVPSIYFGKLSLVRIMLNKNIKYKSIYLPLVLIEH